MAHRTPAAAVAVAAAVLIAACSGGGHEAHDRLPPTSPAAAPSGTPSGSADRSEPVLAHGVITSPDGTPVADAVVQLTTEPTDAQLATIDPFEYPLTPVAETRTGPDGRYELRIPADKRAELPVDASGQVQYVVIVDSPDGGAMEFWTGPGAPTHPHSLDLELIPGA